LHADDNIKK